MNLVDDNKLNAEEAIKKLDEVLLNLSTHQANDFQYNIYPNVGKNALNEAFEVCAKNPKKYNYNYFVAALKGILDRYQATKQYGNAKITKPEKE